MGSAMFSGEEPPEVEAAAAATAAALKSNMSTGAKQIAKLCAFILFLADCEVTFDKWSMTKTRQF